MKRWMVGALLVGAIVVLAGLPALASAISSHDDDGAGHGAASAAHSREHKAEARQDHGHGPPPWAHRPDSKAGPDSNAGGAAADEWKKLTPEQRADLMAKLVREHAEGMKQWGKCVEAKRDDCVRPLPPGLAKRR